MHLRAWFLFGSIVLSASAGADPRPPLRSVSAVRIANYGAPSVLLESRAQVRSVVEELNQLRRSDWRRGDANVSCYSTVVLMSGKKKAGEFRVTPETIVERPVDKGQSIYSLAVGQGEVPILARMLAEILPAKDCK